MTVEQKLKRINNDTRKYICKCVIWERLTPVHQMRTLKEFSFIPTPQAAVEPHCWNRFNYKLPTLEKRGTKTETQELQNWYLDISLYTYHSEVWFFHPGAKESQSTSVRFKYLVEIHFFPIPVHELLFKLWWRCSLEVAGCSLEEEPTAHLVFPLCSGSFAWNQHYVGFLLLWKCKTFLQFPQVSLKFWSTFNSKQQLLQHTQFTPPRNLGAFRVFQWVGHNIGIEPAKTGSQWVGVASNKEARGRFQRTAPPPLFLPGKQWNWIRKGFAPSVCAGSTRSPAIQEPLQLRTHEAAAA